MHFAKKNREKDAQDDAVPASLSSSGTEADEDHLTSTKPRYGSFEPHVFSNPARAEHWMSVYEQARYECRHRVDPTFQWSAEAEKRVARKVDVRIFLLVWSMYASLDLVRRNINRAISDNMLDDLNINTNDFNTGQTIYLLFFLAAELPGGLISKKVGPFRYTPAVIVLWGTISACQAGMSARWSFWLLRALLGLAQGGFIPEMILYLSYFYKASELSIRMSWFYTGIPIAQTIGALLAGGILKMRGLSGWAGWQWLFLLEGLMSVLVGVAAWFLMSPSITEPATAFKRKDGTNKWWTEEEEKILVNRLLRDDPTKGDMNNRTAVSFKEILRTIITPDLLPVYIVGLFAWIPFQPTANYLSLTLRELGYTVFEANVLTIPSYALFAINVVLFGSISEKLNERFLVGACSNIWMLPFFAALIAIKPDASPWIRYTLLTGINSLPYAHSIMVGVASRNSMSVGRRAVAAAIYNMTYQIGSIAAVNIYREGDAPLYYTANRGLLGMCCANICLFILAKLYYMRRNRLIDKATAGASETEKARLTGLRFVH